MPRSAHIARAALAGLAAFLALTGSAVAATLTVNDDMPARPGDRVIVNASGVPADEAFEIFIDDRLVGHATSDAAGGLSVSVKLPKDIEPQGHHVQVSEKDGNFGVGGNLTVAVGIWRQAGRNASHTAYSGGNIGIPASDVDDLIDWPVVSKTPFTGLAVGARASWLTTATGRLVGSCESNSTSIGATASGPSLRSAEGLEAFAIGTSAQAKSTLYSYTADKNNICGGVTQKWRSGLGALASGPPVVAETGKVIVALASGGLRAFDPGMTLATTCTASGASYICPSTWRATFGPTSQTPTVGTSRVFIGTAANELRAYDLDCGTANAYCSPVWTTSLPNGFHLGGSMLTAAHGLLFGALSSNLTGLDDPPAQLGIWSQSTGALVRTVPLTGAGALDHESSSVPAVARGVAYVGTSSGQLYAIRVVDGAILWTAAKGGSGDSQPAVGSGVVFSIYRRQDGESFLNAFRASCSGECLPLWTSGVEPQTQSPVLLDQAIFTFGAHGLQVWVTRAFAGNMLD